MRPLYTSLFTLLVLLSGTANAQYQRVCGHDDILNFAQAEMPDFDAQYDAIYDQARNWAEENARGGVEDTVYTIHVVFHILYEANDPYQLISDELIHSQLAALNRDFNMRNADTVDTREFFKSRAGNSRIEFVLAKRISDQCKDAIIKKQWTAPDAVLPIYGDFMIKDDFWGGSSAWNTSKYLNIWVADLNKSSGPGDGFLGGYAFLPGLIHQGLPVPARHDGVVIDFRFFGQDNPWIPEVQPGFANYTQGRTTVHEVGHWLGLRHIWGDLGTIVPELGCDADDGVDDTPNAAQPYAAHGFCQDTIVNSCDEGIEDLPDMFENYMDYSTDECNTMFTKGQVDVMRYTLTDFRKDVPRPYDDYPVSSSISAELDEETSVDLCYEVEECFGNSDVDVYFCEDDSIYTSALGEAELVDGELCFTYSAGEYLPDNVDEFCLVVYDHHHNQYDTTYIDITVNDVMDTVINGIDLLSSENNNIDVFPNPTSGSFNVLFNGYQKKTVVKLYSTLGAVLLERELAAGVRNVDFDIDRLPTGAYVISFETEEALSFEKILLK